MASPSGTGGIRLERLNRCYECEVAFPEPVPVEQAMDDFGDYLDGVGYLCSACADEFDGPAERGPSGTGHDRATAERRLHGRNVTVRPLGRCCGRWFYTYDGWLRHRREEDARVR